MDVFSVTQAYVTNIRNAFQVISLLCLTCYMWPESIPIPQCPQEYDVIVVGGGSAGSVVAGRLAEAKMHVLLIEAGGDPPIETTYPSLYPYLLNSHVDWNYTNQDDYRCADCQKNQIILSRGKMLGGSGSMNGMLYVRGNPHDFNTWAQIVNDSTWSYEEVLPFFKKSEMLLDPEVLNSNFGKFHGTEGPMKITRNVHNEMDLILKAFEEVGHKIYLDTNANESLGFSHPMYNIADGRRWSSAIAFISLMKDNPYLHVLKNTQVTKVLFDDFNNAIGVEAITEDDTIVTFKAKKEVILTAGVFGSPQILMLSGIGPKVHLKSLGIQVKLNLPVGENFQDHLGIFLVYSMDRSKVPKVPQQPSTQFPGYMVLGFSAHEKSQSYSDYQVFTYRLPDDKKGGALFCSSFFNLKDTLCEQVYEVAMNRTLLLTAIAAFNLKSRGFVMLNSTNPRDLTRNSLGWFNVEEDIDTVAQYIEDFVKVGDSDYFKSVDAELLLMDLPKCKHIEKGTREYWKCYVKCLWVTEYHYAGTCALGNVVDSHLQVKGVQNLRVADSSIMPIVVSGNTNAATVMIGEKAAQFVIDKYNTQ